jgi:GAF domain-containing protein
MLRGLADQAGLAIENARLYEESQQRVGEMAALYDTALDVAAQLDTRQVLQTIVERATDLLNGMGGAMYLYRSEQDDLELALTHKLEPDFTGTVLRRGEGLSGKVLESGESTIVDCYREWSGRSRLYEGAPFEAVIAVPVRWGEQILGVINVLREPEAEAFDDQDVRLLTLFANQAAVAIENAQLYEKATNRMREATALHRVSGTLMCTLNLDQLLESILEVLQRLFGHPHCSILLLDEETEELYVKAACGYLQEKVTGLRIKIGQEGITSWVAANRVPLNVPDVTKDDRYVEGIKGTRSEIVVPMLVGEKLVGVLDVQSTEVNAFGKGDRRILSSIAAQAAIAIERARLYEAEAQRRQEAETLRQAAAVLTSTLDLEETLDRILEQLHRVVAYDSASVQLLRDDHLEIVGGRGFADASAVIGLRFPVPGDNPNTRVIESGEPIILAEAQAAHAPFCEPPHDHIRSWLGVPVRFHERTIGLITLDSTESGHFTADHARMAAAFANQAAIALENARLFMATHRQAQQLEALRQVTQDLIALRDLDTLLHQIIERAMQLLDGEAGGLYLYRPEREVLEWAVAIGENVSPIGTTLSRGEGLSGKVWATGKPLIVGDYGGWVGRSPKWPDLPASVVGVPIQWGDEFLGVLNIRAQSSRGCFTSGDAVLLSQFAAQAAIAVKNARLYQQVVDLADNLERRVEERTEALAHRAQELSSLYQSSVALSSSLEVEEVLEALAQQAVRAVDAVDCTICELQDDALVIVASYSDPALSWKDPEIGRRYLLADYPATRQAIEKWQPLRVRVDNPRADEAERAELQEFGYTALLQVPIVSRDQVLGIAEVFDNKPEREFSEGDAALLQTIANQAGMAIEKARLFQHLRGLPQTERQPGPGTDPAGHFPG